MLFKEKEKQIKNIFFKIEQYLKAKTIKVYEINYYCSLGRNFTVRNLKNDNIEFNLNQNLVIKLYHQGKIGYTKTTNINNINIEEIINKAISIVNHTEPDKFSGIVDKKFLCIPKKLNNIYYPLVEYYKINNIIEYIKQLEANCINHKQIEYSTGVNFNYIDIIYAFTNSYGFLDIYPESRYTLGLDLITYDDYGMQSHYLSYSNFQLLKIPDIKTISDIAVKRTINKRNPKKIKTQSLPIIFVPLVARSFWRILLSAIEGENQYLKNTFLLNKINNKVVSSDITMIENPNIKYGLGNQPYDNEGVNFNKNPIIINGILKRYLLNSYTARKLNSITTGNAGGISNILITTNNNISLKNMIKKIQKGIMITEIMGQGFNIITGNYSHGAIGFYIKDGEIQFPINNFTISGNLNYLFNNILNIANDIDIYSNIRTGSVLIKNALISSD